MLWLLFQMLVAIGIGSFFIAIDAVPENGGVAVGLLMFGGAYAATEGISSLLDWRAKRRRRAGNQ